VARLGQLVLLAGEIDRCKLTPPSGSRIANVIIGTSRASSRSAVTKPKPDHFFEDANSTLRPLPAPMVLVVGGPEALVLAARQVAHAESPTISVQGCDVAEAINIATRHRPFAIVMSQDVYAFDPNELAALARDLQAELVVLKVSRVTPGFLEQALRPSLRHAFRRFRSVVESGPVTKG